MPTYILTGDIIMAARVSIDAPNLEDAVFKAENEGGFVIDETYPKQAVFEFCGDEEGGVEIA